MMFYIPNPAYILQQSDRVAHPWLLLGAIVIALIILFGVLVLGGAASQADEANRRAMAEMRRIQQEQVVQ